MDLVAEKNGKKIAIEIETGCSDIKANVKKCLDAEFDEIVFMATNHSATKQLHDLKTNYPSIQINFLNQSN